MVETHQILCLRGYFEHNNECKAALLQRIPPLPLHPRVHELALTALTQGVSLSTIQQNNREWVRSGGEGYIPEDARKWKFRFLIQRYNTRSFYWQFNRMNGVKISGLPHINLDEWLDPGSLQYNKTLASAVLHYSARVTKGERLEVCIATEEMKEAAWKYGHQSQIILDGTFGICDKRLLLFIIMGIDERGQGIPLAFLIFSAPSGNQQSSAGYDTEILVKLLNEWRKSLGKNTSGKVFNCVVAITDTDLKERAALIRVFPDILLLICKFHIRQSWRNYRNKLLKGKAPALMEIKERLCLVEQALITTMSLKAAMEIVADENSVLETMTEDSHAPAAQKGIQHLRYLSSYWLTFDLWASWSEFGRHSAAKILGCALNGVLPTTNHLESFNGILKRKHLRW